MVYDGKQYSTRLKGVIGKLKSKENVLYLTVDI